MSTNTEKHAAQMQEFDDFSDACDKMTAALELMGHVDNTVLVEEIAIQADRIFEKMAEIQRLTAQTSRMVGWLAGKRGHSKGGRVTAFETEERIE